MPPRYPSNPHRVTLDLDPVTSDALTRAAKAVKSDRQRLAYDFIQRGLGIGMTAPIGAGAPATEPDPFASSIQRGLDAISNYKPKGSA